MQGEKSEKTSFKDQALLNQAKNAYQNKHTDQAIECVSQAIELNETKVELYLFRSRCYASVARTAEAIQDAEKAIQLEAEEMKLQSGLQLCGGFYARAEAKFLSGDFEEALVDYNRCAARRHDVLYNQGIDKAQFNIRKAFEFTGSQVRIAEQALLKGVLLEAETKAMTFAPEATLVRFPTFQIPDDDLSALGGTETNQNIRAGSRGSAGIPGGHIDATDVLKDLSNREMLLPTAQIHYILVKEARKNPMYQKLQKLTEDKTFLEFIEPMPNLAATCQKAIAFINEREKYWKDQNHQNLDINEIKPQPERRTKSVKNMKDFAKYSALRKQQRLALMRGTDKNVTFAKMQESRKVFYQKSAQQIREQNQAVEEQQNEEHFELVLLNIEECISNGCDSLAMEFVREFFAKLTPPPQSGTVPISGSTWTLATCSVTQNIPSMSSGPSPEYKPYYLQALQIKALLLIHQGAYKDAKEVFAGLDQTKMGRQFVLLFQRLNAIILCRMGQLEEGLLALEQLLQEPGLDTTFQLDVKILLAGIYGESGRYQQALDCCRAVYRPLRSQAEAHGETTIYKLDKEVQLYNKMTVTEVFVRVLQIEADALKELKMDLEHAEKVREIKRVQKRLD